MATKIKGLCKSFKYITQIFVVKEREMEIGCPTDVKHVAHIGWDGPSGTGPSWMNEFKTSPNFSTSLGMGERRDANSTSSWSIQDFEESPGSELTSNTFKDIPSAPKKQKRRKSKSTSYPRSSSSSTTRHSRAPKPKATFTEREAPPIVQV